MWGIFTSSQNKIVTLWLKVQNAAFFFSFTWTYMNWHVTELPKCENHAKLHQHLYVAGMWRASWQMCNSNPFVAPRALYLSQESYYLLGWAEKHLKHNSNNNKASTSQLGCLLQNELPKEYFCM